MPPIEEDEPEERRYRTAVAVAVHTEQLKSLSQDVTEVKGMLKEHIDDEQKTFDKIIKSISELKECIDIKIQPITKELIKYKWAIGLIGSVLSVAAVFHDHIWSIIKIILGVK